MIPPRISSFTGRAENERVINEHIRVQYRSSVSSGYSCIEQRRLVRSGRANALWRCGCDAHKRAKGDPRAVALWFSSYRIGGCGY